AGADRRLVVSYSYYHPDKSCFTVRLAVHPLDAGWDDPLPEGAAPDRAGWQVVYETRPCLPFKRKRHPYSGQQAGGRMVSDGKGALYLTVGDHEFDGIDGADSSPAYSQLADADYGKVLRFDTRDWSAAVFTIGHRNPQGITIDDDGRVWAVEHGPMGGDELNLLRAGANYGWPIVTLGVYYTERENDTKRWPFNPRQGWHEGYQAPVHAWVPSKGLGNVKVLRDLNARIDGDLLVVGMAAWTLYRMRIENERVVYAEPISVTGRIRYAEVANGEIYLLLDDGRFATMRPRPTGDLEDGTAASVLEPALAVRDCQECHVRPDSPHLRSILGSAVASQEGVRYTPALIAAGGLWSEERLRAFLDDPQAFAPGTAMPDPGLGEAEIAAVLDALKPRAD
ncbi:MAG: PQQ-dependent sugar dehydrogenase, partial [Mesorhizobium sp.]|nr:PQQ-dependent sugar dehydrogenase [Mesorhizobium sp.]